MRLVCYAVDDGPRAGVVVDDDVVDVAAALGEPVVRDVQALLELPYDALSRLRERGSVTSERLPLARVEILPPVLRPPSIRDHIAFEEHATRNFTRPVPEVWSRRPIHYYSNTSRLLGNGALVPFPATVRLDYELEIALVIARQCADVTADEAMDYVAGFTILNDWSARDLQADEMAYGLGPSKGKDFATSLGPWLVTCDELEDALTSGRLDARCEVRVNGQTWALSNAVDMFHSWGAMIAHASQDSVLVPGDVIAGGTVGGCSIGEAIRTGYPARYLEPGDVVELEVAGIGCLANTVGPRRVAKGDGRYWAKELPPMPEPIPADAVLVPAVAPVRWGSS